MNYAAIQMQKHLKKAVENITLQILQVSWTN